jgi:outer membrane protein insertion porin family
MRYLFLFAFYLTMMPALAQAQAGDGRIYIKRIEFLGTDRINDKVLRRELRQAEGTHINTVALEQSRLRLERLPYVERAQITQRPVKDAPDQVDILITITEAPARQYRFGGAYSESLRLTGYGYFINENLFGTGQRFFARVDVSEFHTAAQLSHTDPYARPTGISRTIAIEWRDIDQLTADTSELEADLTRTRLEYGYQIAERQSIRLGLAFQDAEIIAGPFASNQLLDWVRNNGNPTVQSNQSSTDYLNVDFLFGWHHDTRDKKIFPDRGLEQLLNLKIAVPGSEIEYYTIDYALSKYWPLRRGWTAKLNTKLGYGAKYGSKTTSLAPNLNWFAGGLNSVRGYR